MRAILFNLDLVLELHQHLALPLRYEHAGHLADVSLVEHFLHELVHSAPCRDLFVVAFNHKIRVSK